MTKSLTYVEIDIPDFAETHAAGFDGSTYLLRGGGLTGAADSKLCTISFWARLQRQNAGQNFFTGAGRVRVWDTFGNIVFTGSNAAGAGIVEIYASTLAANDWAHFLMSFDLSDTAKRHIYINDVADFNFNVYTNDTIDFTVADWAVGRDTGGVLFPLYGGIADFWFMPGTYIDFSVEANRRKFIDADGFPVDLGPTGAIPTGSAPLVFMSGALSGWQTNKGTGGGFSVTAGALYDIEGVPRTVRYAIDALYLPRSIACIPNLVDVKIDPAIVSLGGDLGTRAKVTATFRDHKHIFADEDYNSGSYWAKFRARYGLKLRGHPLRIRRGVLGDTLANMETRHFIIESTDGPTSKGEYKIIANDVLKFADGDRAQAPVLSNGFLSADITAVATSATLSPSGIGNSEYPSSNFYVAIGGSEIALCTSRTNDVLTLTRAQFNTVAVAHTAQDRVQRCLHFNGQDVADIIYSLLVGYAAVDPDFIPLTTWQAESDAFLNQVYTALIAEPTSVNALISELIEQAGLAIWWDDRDQQIKFQVLRQIATTVATYNGENIIAESLNVKEQPEKRLSQIYTYFAKINPLINQDQIDNYRSTAFSSDDIAEFEYRSAAIKKIFSRWIPAGGRAIAETLNDILLSRFRDPPRLISFDLLRYSQDDPAMGLGYNIGGWLFQDESGAAATVPVQLTRINPRADIFEVESEEMLFAPTVVASPDNHIIIIDGSQNNINLRTMHDSIYGVPLTGATVNATITSGVTVGSNSRSVPALDIGTWPGGITINLIVLGRIQGCGGGGGAGGSAILASATSGSAGQMGGTALYTRRAINLTSTSAQIWGGGGGAGGGGGFTNGTTPQGGCGGGGGAGTNGGAGGTEGFGTTFSGPGGFPGTATAGGAGGAGGSGGSGGSGGGPGLAGSGGGGAGGDFPTSGGAGGAAGRSIDGNTFISYVGGSPDLGDIRGPRVN